MKNDFEGNFLEDSGQDVTAEFMKGTGSFRTTESSLLRESFLKLELDLATVTDRMEFILLARRAKAFVDTKFASGVEWRDAEEK